MRAQEHPDIVAWTLLAIAGILVMIVLDQSLGMSICLISASLLLWSYRQVRQAKRRAH